MTPDQTKLLNLITARGLTTQATAAVLELCDRLDAVDDDVIEILDEFAAIERSQA